MKTLRIIHLDMDAFYASVEQRDNPQYRGKPIVVGGNPHGRGVVSTASYQARKYGIHSAMPCRIAAELCPDAIFLPVDMKKYKKVSNEIYCIFQEYTDIIEPVSIDEAFLEIRNGDAIDIGLKIKKKIWRNLSLTASVGVSYNKFMAKIASELEKPDGYTIMTSEKAKKILPRLPIRKMWGVGEKTEKELNDIGIFTIKDLLEYDREFLLRDWGRRAYDLIQLAQGIDASPVQVDRGVKSLGEETTLEKDSQDINVLKKYLKEFSLDICRRMDRQELQCRTITVKIKYHNFKNITRSITIPHPTSSFHEIDKHAAHLLYNKVPLIAPVRLIGLQVSNLIYPDEPVQISFID